MLRQPPVDLTVLAKRTDIWMKVLAQCDAKATSIGALMDSMHESVIDKLDGAEITLKGYKSHMAAEGELEIGWCPP
jgi:hypothetical protein